MATFFSNESYGVTRNKEYRRARYQYLKENGICVDCGQAPSDKGRVRCFACRLAFNDYLRNTEESEARKAKHREREKRKYHHYKELGLCVVCHKNKTVDGSSRCKACKKKESNWFKRNYIPKYRPESVCRSCQEPPVPGYKYCTKHLQLIREAGLKGTQAAKKSRELNGKVWSKYGWFVCEKK